MGQDLFNPPHCTGGVLHATRKLCRDESSRTKERDEGTGGGGEALHDLVSRTSLAFPFPYNHLPVKSIFPSFNPRTYDPPPPPPPSLLLRLPVHLPVHLSRCGIARWEIRMGRVFSGIMAEARNSTVKSFRLSPLLFFSPFFDKIIAILYNKLIMEINSPLPCNRFSSRFRLRDLERKGGDEGKGGDLFVVESTHVSLQHVVVFLLGGERLFEHGDVPLIILVLLLEGFHFRGHGEQLLIPTLHFHP